jgi:tetratricopeptide (TPR) repeat protein
MMIVLLTDRTTRPAGRASRTVILAIALLVGWAPVVPGGQDKEPPESSVTVVERELSLLEQDPFDLITLDAANDNAQLKVLPLMDGTRKAPLRVDLGKQYTVRLVEDDTEQYTINGRNIVRIELYEEQLLKEAQRLMKAQELDEAFDYFFALQSNYPDLPGLDQAFNEYLYRDAGNMAKSGRLAEALSSLEELLSRDAGYRYPGTTRSLWELMDAILSQIVDKYVDQGAFGSARRLLARVDKDYGDDELKSVARWINQLISMAIDKREEARELMNEERFREAIAAAKDMVRIWPNVEGGRELEQELSQLYPLVAVGVLQPALSHDAQRLDNWGARRTGRLVFRDLVEFLGAGPEGGQYEFPLGIIERSDDRRQMIFRLNRMTDPSLRITGYDLARRLLELADTRSPDYLSAWSSLVTGARVQDVLEVHVDLRRAHVLPEALLRIPLNPARKVNENGLPEGDGAFAVDERSENLVRFSAKEFTAGGRLAEIVERTFLDSQQALGALRRGDVDILDRLFPADALRLEENQTPDDPIQVDSYALPTVHMLVPNVAKNPFLANRDFRRALAFGIDRENILNQELLGGREVYGCRVVSGPFPAGGGEADPLGYAYDAQIRPRPYRPRLAKLLTIVAQAHVAEAADRTGDPEPELGPLTLGHPAHEAARVACQAIALQWKILGLECNLVEFPPGVTRDVDGQCDLVYAEIAIWEPVVDARRLLGAQGPAASESSYVQQALRWLDATQSWGEVRERLLQLHGSVHNDVSIIPLWQLVDFFAYHDRIRNIGEHPVWLYQHVDQWRLSVATAE